MQAAWAPRNPGFLKDQVLYANLNGQKALNICKSMNKMNGPNNQITFAVFFLKTIL
jgi:hypothetical protein